MVKEFVSVAMNTFALMCIYTALYVQALLAIWSTFTLHALAY